MNRVAVVTGAASGIGLGIARAAARRGYALALVDRREDALADTAEELRSVAPAVSAHGVDVADREAMQTLALAVAEAHGPAVHLLANNAGIGIDGWFEEQTLDDWERIVGVNLMGVVYGTKVFWDALMTADRATIINISSVFGIVAPPVMSSYAATKFAVRGLSESLWAELADTHIHMAVVHPAGVATRIVEDGVTHYEAGKASLARRFARAGIPPDIAGEKILARALAGKKRIFVARGARTMDRLKRLLPIGGAELVVRIVEKQMKLSARRDAVFGSYRDRRRALGFGDS